MNCEKFRLSIAAFLAGELDKKTSEEHRRHAEECPNCAAEINSTATLVDMLKAHPVKDVPNHVEARVLNGLEPLRGKYNQQKPSPAPLLSCIQGAFTMKRAMIAVGLIVVAIVVGLGLLPLNKGNAVLAQVARAMENVKSAHVVGYEIRPETGERRDLEMWIKHPEKFRAQVKVGDGLYELADDGTKRVELDQTRGACSATISPSEGLSKQLPGLSWFHKEGMLETTKMGIVEIRLTTLPDGRAAQVIELAGMDPSYAKTVITIDEATDLLVELADYRDGKLTMKIERIDYNVDLPDSMFEIKIPKNASVDDKLHPVPESPERQAMRAAASKKMDEENGDMIAGGLPSGDHCGAPRHSGIKFEIVGPGKASIWYVMSRNAYYVFGKVIVTDSKKRGYRRVVEDGWVIAPYKPDRLPGIFQMRINKPGRYKKFILPWDCGYNGFGAERIQNIGNGPLILMNEVLGIRFYGEAKIYPQGKVYHNGQVVNLNDIRTYGPNDEYDIAKADFGNLPASEIKAMKAEMKKHNAVWRRYYRNQETARKRLGKDVEIMSNFLPGYGGSCNYFQNDPEVGMALYYIPSRDSVYIAGRARMVTRHFFRRVERIVENEEIKAPGPEYARYYKEKQKKLRQGREYAEYRKHTKQDPPLNFDEWVKQHPEID